MIPDEAVEAALAARLAFRNKRGRDNAVNMMRACLEAAALHMLEQAYTDGYCDGMSGDQHKVDQYRPTP